MTDRRVLISALQRRIHETLGPLLDGVRRVALLDFPSYANVGDSAIWLGTLVHLMTRPQIRVVYTADRQSYVESHLRARLRDGTILITGGGNLGDLWEPSQQLREAVVSRFPQHRIVQLPQTIWFNDAKARVQAKRCFDAHEGLTLLVRDGRSLDFAANELRAPVRLCPDMAFALGPLPSLRRPTHPVVRLLRRDHESADRDRAKDGVDWTVEPNHWAHRPYAVLTRAVARHPRGARPLRRALSALYEPLARARVAHGTALLGSGRTVITDRLHGHILCLLMGIPHFVFGDRYGKVQNFHDAWTRDADVVTWCSDRSDAERRAASYLGDELGALT